MKKITLIALSACVVGAANASVTLYSTSFENSEPEAWVGGQTLISKPGWFSTTAGTNNVVNTFMPHTGIQSSTMISSSVAATGRWTWKDVNAAWLARPSSEKAVLSCAWFKFDASNTTDHQYGLDAYTFEVQQLGQIVISGGTNTVWVNGADTGFGVVKTDWNLLAILTDFTSNNAHFYANNVYLGFASMGANTGNFGDCDLYNQSVTGVASTVNRSVYVDDYKVVTAVPEPGSMIALGAGALALVARRRRKA